MSVLFASLLLYLACYAALSLDVLHHSAFHKLRLLLGVVGRDDEDGTVCRHLSCALQWSTRQLDKLRVNLWLSPNTFSEAPQRAPADDWLGEGACR